MRPMLLALLCACAVPPRGSAPAADKIPGTAVSIPMVALPGTRLAMGATEITWDAYDVFVYGLDGPDPEVPPGVDAIARPSQPSALAFDRGFGHAGHPAISISYRGATEFCRWLSLRTGRRYRLPTEAEWDLAAAGGTGEGWTSAVSGGRTHPVATRAPSASGLFDLAGNAAEWCETEDGRGVLRGGSWRDDAPRLAPSPDWNRSDPQVPKSRWWLADAPFAGFRVVRED